MTKVKRSIPNLLQDKTFPDTLEKHLVLQDAVIKASFSDHDYLMVKVGNMTCHFSQSPVLGVVNDAHA